MYSSHFKFFCQMFLVVGLILSGERVFASDLIRFSAWKTLLQDQDKISQVYRSEAKAETAKSESVKSDQAAILIAKNRKFLDTIKKDFSSAQELQIATQEIENESDLSLAIHGFEISMIEARRADFDIYVVGWMRMANSILATSQNLVGLRLAGLIRSMAMDEIESALKNGTIAANKSELLKKNIESISLQWPIDKIIQSELTRAHFEVSEKIGSSKSVDGETAMQILGLSGDRARDLMLNHRAPIDKEEFITDTDHYAQWLITAFKNNPYQSQTTSMERLIMDRWQRLMGEAGSAGVWLQDPNDEELKKMDAQAFAKLRKNFLTVRNPVGRLLSLRVLHKLAQIYRPQDVEMMKTELSRWNVVKTQVALNVYKTQHNSRAPASLQELVTSGLLPSVPMDYFTGKPLRYSENEAKVYSQGIR